MPHNEEWYDDDAGPLVRPYAITSGRTRSAHSPFELEALVSTTNAGYERVAELESEHQAIAVICQSLQSIAEISSRLDLPVGVVRVLVADLVDAGLVSVSRPAHDTDRPAASLMERVLDGLQSL